MTRAERKGSCDKAVACSVISGADLTRNPKYNKGLAFTETERDRLYLRGLLPPAILSQDVQVDQQIEMYLMILFAYAEYARWASRLHIKQQLRLLVSTLGCPCYNSQSATRSPSLPGLHTSCIAISLLSSNSLLSTWC